MIVFIDDILMYSKTEEDHNRHLRIVLMRLRKVNLYVELFKCDFGLIMLHLREKLCQMRVSGFIQPRL